MVPWVHEYKLQCYKGEENDAKGIEPEKHHPAHCNSLLKREDIMTLHKSVCPTMLWPMASLSGIVALVKIPLLKLSVTAVTL